MIHRWSSATDGNGAVTRSILFDYRKAFDFIDHSILIQKLSELEIPNSIINWISDFLTKRVKLADTFIQNGAQFHLVSLKELS